MMDWRKKTGEEVRAVIVMAPLLVASALLVTGSAISRAAERLSQSPVSPVSPVPSPAPPSDVVSLGLSPWLLVIAAAVLIILVVVVSRTLRTRGWR